MYRLQDPRDDVFDDSVPWEMEVSDEKVDSELLGQIYAFGTCAQQGYYAASDEQKISMFGRLVVNLVNAQRHANKCAWCKKPLPDNLIFVSHIQDTFEAYAYCNEECQHLHEKKLRQGNASRRVVMMGVR